MSSGNDAVVALYRHPLEDMVMRQIRKHKSGVLLAFVYGCASLQFLRFYVRHAIFYLDMQLYMAGGERLPFQQRVFPILILKPLTNSVWVKDHLVHSAGVFTLEHGPFYLLSLLAFAVAAIYTQRLYNSLSDNDLLRALVFPVFLFAVMFTFAIHSEADFAYPYDLTSLAFFAAGLFYVYRRAFIPLFLIILVGTFNRETTLFLIALYAIDAASGSDEVAGPISLRAISWMRLGLLAAVWVAVQYGLAHRFAQNDASERFLRIHDNLKQLRPRLVPALLNICGYTLPMVLVLRRWLMPVRFRRYLWVLPLWLAVMFCSGVLVETRIYGELCSFSAVALVLILERWIVAQFRWGSLNQEAETASLFAEEDDALLEPAA